MVINALGGGHTHATYTGAQTKTISRNHAHTAKGHMPGLKTNLVYTFFIYCTTRKVGMELKLLTGLALSKLNH